MFLGYLRGIETTALKPTSKAFMQFLGYLRGIETIAAKAILAASWGF